MRRRIARLLVETFIDTDGVAAGKPSQSKVDKHRATIVDLVADRRPSGGAVRDGPQTFYLEPDGTTRLIVIDGDAGAAGDRHRADADATPTADRPARGRSRRGVRFR